MKRLTLLLFLFAFTIGTLYSQDGIYLFGSLTDGPGEPVEMTATIYSEPEVVVDFSTTPSGEIEIFWVPLPSQDWTHLTVAFENCQDFEVTYYVMNDSVPPMVDVYLGLNYCNYTWGCMDTTAMNYNPAATADDGSCIYASVPNDHCADAIPLNPGTMIIDNTGATNTGEIFGACWGFGNGEAEQNSLWYSFTTPDGPASIHIGTYSDATYSLTDTQFGVFESCGGEMIYCDGNSGPGLYAALDFECGTLEENTTYILMIDGWNGDSGSCMLNFVVDTACTGIPGCTDPNANNYNPWANINDGSCEYDEPCTGTEVYLSYAFMSAGDTAQIVTWSITNSSGETVAFGEENWEQASYPFCLEDGCYTFAVSNVPTSWEGYFNLSGGGVFYAGLNVDGSSTSYSANFSVNTPDCEGVEDLYGCTDPEAINYDPTAIIDDGSCEYEGSCGEEAIFNYLFPSQTDSVNLDWQIINDLGDVVEEGQGTWPQGGQIYCLEDGCYTFTINNVPMFWEGYMTLWNNDDTWFWMALDGNSQTYTIDFDINNPDCGGMGEVLGCTNPEADNYNPEATTDDGSCTFTNCFDVTLDFDLIAAADSLIIDWSLSTWNGIPVASGTVDNMMGAYPLCLPEGCYSLSLTNDTGDWNGMVSVTDSTGVLFSGGFYGVNPATTYFFGVHTTTDCDSISPGCTDPLALNYNPNANLNDGSCEYDTNCTVIEMVFEYSIPVDSAIVVWSLVNEAGTYEVFGYFDGLTSLNEVCLLDGCYSLTLNNIGANPGGGLSIFQANELVLNADHPGMPGGYTYTFGVNTEGCDEPVEVSGCTDPDALNYNPEATVDNGSCLYGCIDPGCEVDVNSAEYIMVISNDPFCCNNSWDQLCQNAYETLGGMPNSDPDCDQVLGCTDPDALNYNPEATIDDGSCTYFNTDCEISFLVLPDSLGENVIWVVTNFDPDSTISVLWDFGDGNTTTEWYPSHTYADEGPYTLCVTVVIGEPANAECAASFCMEVDGGMIGSGLVSSGFTINVIDGSTLVSNADIERDFDLRLWPNPAHEIIQLQLTAEMGSNSVLRIFDLTGKTVNTTNLAASPGANSFTIDLNGLESGIYTMELMGDEGRWVEKFVVGR